MMPSEKWLGFKLIYQVHYFCQIFNKDIIPIFRFIQLSFNLGDDEGAKRRSSSGEKIDQKVEEMRSLSFCKILGCYMEKG